VGAPLKFVSDLTITLGACTVPIILLVLGASLSNGPQTLHISASIIFHLFPRSPQRRQRSGID
jgi:predicted permease